MESWSQADVFPIIHRLITEAYERSTSFITSREIASLMLSDAEGRAAMLALVRITAKTKRMSGWLGTWSRGSASGSRRIYLIGPTESNA